MAVKHINLFDPAERQQLMAAQMMQTPAIDTSQFRGRQTPEYGIGHGLIDAGQKLAAAWMARKADKRAAADDEKRRQAQAEALAGLSRPENLVETPEAQSPYSRAQNALNTGVDPSLVEAYMGQKLPKQGGNQFGVVNPSDFTPESMRKFAQSGDYGDLVPVEKNLFGRYNPRDYTPESLAIFNETGNPADLVRVAPYQFKDTPGGGVEAFDPITGQRASTPRTSEQGTQEAAERAAAEAEAKARAAAKGAAEGAILSKATNAEGIKSILEMAPALIDVATGSGAGAARDKVAAFFGQSTEGDQAIAQLKVLQAGLMMAMPRMEGPQSDRDVQLYREAAAELGDPSVPRERKHAALSTIIAMQDKYIQRAQSATLPEVIPNSSSGQMQQMTGTQVVDWGSM